MEMIEMLKPIAFDVIICMTQLFDYYLYTIYTLFACDMDDIPVDALNSRLRFTIKRIKDNLIAKDDSETMNNVDFNLRKQTKISLFVCFFVGKNQCCSFVAIGRYQ